MPSSYPMQVRTVIIAVVLSLIVLGVWEYSVRQMGFGPWVEDDKHLWAELRAKVDKAGPEDVVLIGSSRVLFDIQIDVWEEETGRKPVQLALPGSGALPIFKDIVEKTDFAGTLLVGVTPPLYFIPPIETIPPWSRPMERVNHYYERTYAERFGHWLSFPLQRTFALLENDDDAFYNDLDLRTMVKRVYMKQRVPDHPPFPFFGHVNRDRNMTMLKRAETDTAYANMIKAVWGYYGQQWQLPPEDLRRARDAAIGMSIGWTQQFKARGGKIIFVRCPSSGPFLQGEDQGYPRAEFWDQLLQATGCPGYYFQDYEFMNKYVLPEWSHLATPDAKQFTRDLVRQMKTDGHL